MPPFFLFMHFRLYCFDFNLFPNALAWDQSFAGKFDNQMKIPDAAGICIFPKSLNQVGTFSELRQDF